MPPNLILFAIPAFLGLLIVEAIADAIMRRDLYEWRDTAASLSMGIGNVFINLGAKALIFLFFTWLARFAVWHVPFTWWGWTLGFFADEFSYYWFHRSSHECRFFWASHVVHHSSQRYNLGTALRQTWTGSLTGAFFFWAWMPLAGFSPVMILTLQATSLLYQFWIHTELIRRLGPFESLLNTPSHHRVHHGSNPQYIDRNHGGWLILWDRLFGTYEREDEPVAYGLTRNIRTYNPFRIAFHEWYEMARDVKNARTWRARWNYVFGRPGWTEDVASSSASAD